jgi:hypothetical protein
MTARTEIQSMELATLSISATLPATYDAAGYGSTAVAFTAIGLVENYGTYGLKAQINTFIPVDTGIVSKTKGTKDYGSMQVTLGDVPADAGQVILAAAVESKAHYSAKIVYPLGNGESTPETVYMDVLVSEFQSMNGAANDIRKRSLVLEVCKKPVVVAAT